MTDDTHGFAVAIRLVRISADAARAGSSPYLEDGRSFVRFCDDEPGGISGASAKRADETVFESPEEAEHAVSALLARNAAKARTEKDFRSGLASQLAPTVIGGVTVGGYEIVSRTELVAERAEEVKLAEAKVRAKLELETAKAKEQQAKVDRIAAQLAEAKPVSTPSGEWLRHSTEGQVQERGKADGSVVYRARKAGKVSPSYPTLEEAIAWRDNLPAETPTPVRAAVGIIDPDEHGLPQ